MHVLAWADKRIPLCFITGFSYTKRARTIEHYGGYVSARGFEAAEISVRVNISRAVAMAYGLDYADELENIESLTADKANAQGVVSLGGYPVYPELSFALTNINKTYISDKSSNDVHVLEADITLSGVSCVKEVARQRALIFELDETAIPLPKVTIECQGKTLTIQDSLSISRFETSPDRLDLEVFIGQDDKTVERQSFLNSIIENFATVTCELPQGTVVYNVITCFQIDNTMSITGSIFPESASQIVTKSFVDCDISDVIKDICNMMGLECEVLISGKVDYYLMNGTPIEALQELQLSAGFLVSRQANKLVFAWVPDSIEPQKTLNLTITDDSMDELTGGVLWRDGVNESFVGDMTGNVSEVWSVFNSTEGFAMQVLKHQRYNQTYIRVDDVIDETIGAHSQIALVKNGIEIAVMVDYALFNWLDGTMSLECREVK